MQPEDTSKHAFSQPSQPDFGIRRQDSFISKMHIFGNNVFDRLPS